MCPFQIGQRVKIRNNYVYASDWHGVFVVCGIRWEYRYYGEPRFSISIASEDEIAGKHGETDGFTPNDLVPA